APRVTSWCCESAGSAPSTRRPGPSTPDANRPEEHTMSVSTNDLKNGMTLDLDGQLWTVLDFLHHKPGKGQAVVPARRRNVKTGAVLDRTFKHDEKVGLAILEKKAMQYLYRDGDNLVFMDTDTYEQHPVPSEVAGESVKYLTEGFTPIVSLYEGSAISVE